MVGKYSVLRVMVFLTCEVFNDGFGLLAAMNAAYLAACCVGVPASGHCPLWGLAFTWLTPCLQESRAFHLPVATLDAAVAAWASGMMETDGVSELWGSFQFLFSVALLVGVFCFVTVESSRGRAEDTESGAGKCTSNELLLSQLFIPQTSSGSGGSRRQPQPRLMVTSRTCAGRQQRGLQLPLRTPVFLGCMV